MAYNFKLPELGEGIVEGEIASWLVKTGDDVQEDDIIAEIQNDKATVELPSPVNGKVLELKAEEGDTVEVEQVIVVFDAEGYEDDGGEADSSEQAEDSQTDDTEDTESSQSSEQPAAKEASGGSSDKRVIAMPSVRKYAR